MALLNGVMLERSWAQGSGAGGGAMASGANLDMGVDMYFKGSMDDAMYGNVRLHPLLVMVLVDPNGCNLDMIFQSSRTLR